MPKRLRDGTVITAQDNDGNETIEHEESDDHAERVNTDDRKTSRKLWACTVENCLVRCTTPGNLKVHIRTHSNEKPHACKVDNCPARFREKGQLTLHMKTHTKSKPYACQVEKCKAAFADSSNLRRHVQSVHLKEKPYCCDVKGCEEKFADRTTLIRHRLRHTGEKRFQCSFENCEYAATQKSTLSRHILTHLGQRSFVCTIAGCTASFVQKGALTTHLKMHAGNKQYKCNITGCTAAFVRREHLKSHLRSHTNERPFACEHCRSRFTRSQHLKKHLQLHETQSTFEHVCEFNDNSLTKHADEPSGLACWIRCRTPRDMEHHIQRHHTTEGIPAKFKSETKLATFFDNHHVSYDRDWANRLAFKTCQNIEGRKMSARPDFYLHELSAKLNCLVLVGNDEFAHRQYACDFQRIWNIAHSLQETNEFRDVPIFYVRFNPHHFHIGSTLYDVPLTTAHERLWDNLNRLTSADIQPGVNLIYCQYDRTAENELMIFMDDEVTAEPGTLHYREIYRPCVRAIW